MRALLSAALAAALALAPSLSAAQSTGGGGSIPTPVSVANGGTGASTLTTNGIVYGNGTSPVGVTAVGTSGNVLTSNGTGVAPTFQPPAGGGTGCTVSGTANQAVINNGSTGCSSSSLMITTGGTTINPVAGAASAPAMQFTGVFETGGTGTTNFPHLLIQPSTATASTTWSTTGTALGVNAHTGCGNTIDLQLDGVSKFKVDCSLGAATLGSGLTLGSNGALTWTSRGTLTSPASAVIQLGAADAAAPVAQTLRVQNVVTATSNTAGANATIQLSIGTGTGAGGDLIFKCAPAGSTGSTPNATKTCLTVSNMGVPVLPSFTVSTLPSAPPTGSLAIVSDATIACAFAATPIGGGSTTCKVWYNGSAWVEG